MMVTRYFDEPIPVHYRTDSECKRVPALGVRRSTARRYEVLIDLGASDSGAPGDLGESAETTDPVWVPRSRIRVEDPTMACGCQSG